MDPFNVVAVVVFVLFCFVFSSFDRDQLANIY